VDKNGKQACEQTSVTTEDLFIDNSCDR